MMASVGCFSFMLFVLTVSLIECADHTKPDLAKTEIDSNLVQNEQQTTEKLLGRYNVNLNPNKSNPEDDWQCPNITNTRSLECGCEIPHTLRCSGDVHGLETLAERLRASPHKVSLLDCTLRNVTFLSNARIFENITLHGLVISSGEIKRIHKLAFAGLSPKLQALGLPSNGLLSVPKTAISYLTSLERLDLSNNKIKNLGGSDFEGLVNLTYLELSDNEITSISLKVFENLNKLEVLKLGGNRLGEYPASLQSIGLCSKLRDLDLRSNAITGSLTTSMLTRLINLESLNLEKNLIKSIQNKALDGFSRLKSLNLRHNQIDVLQDHAFYGLERLESLDLSYNGIVAVSGSSLQHLTNLRTLDLTHNFLRALTSDLILPLPSLKQLRLGGNDISMIAKNALDGAKELTSLLLDENPLSCDCFIIYFVEWLHGSKLTSHDMLSPICATPPHLEGAPLFQVPVETLVCDTEDLENDNENMLSQKDNDSITRVTNLTNVRDLSEMIYLTDFHFSADYGLILTWTVNLKNDYTCDAIFVYKEENINEILIDDSTIHCESKIINDKNTVSVIVPDSSVLLLGESYRFCLVLVQQKNSKSELEVGCSNIIKLQTDNQTTNHSSSNVRILSRKSKLVSDIPSIEESTSRSTDDSDQSTARTGIVLSERSKSIIGKDPPYEFYSTLNSSFLPGLGLGILIATLLVLLWAVTRIRNTLRCSPTVETCYTANRTMGHVVDPERGNRYLKLQATTSL